MKKRSKKLISLCVAVGLLVSSLTGCGGSDKGSDAPQTDAAENAETAPEGSAGKELSIAASHNYSCHISVTSYTLSLSVLPLYILPLYILLLYVLLL